jgi:hypothetical protein
MNLSFSKLNFSCQIVRERMEIGRNQAHMPEDSTEPKKTFKSSNAETRQWLQTIQTCLIWTIDWMNVYVYMFLFLEILRLKFISL